tara:strand:- start:312 stop:1013 length:702 start_codon:yes stop_codon:yes gene_type:complete
MYVHAVNDVRGEAKMPTTGAKRDPRFSEEDTTLKIIHAIEHNGATTQRTLAKDVEIALGLTNAYLKRCIKKGWVKVTEAPTQRYFYYLTPKGFSEKARLTASYLSNSFEMFRSARGQCDEILGHCYKKGLSRIALVGNSDLGEVAILSSLNNDAEIIGVLDETSNQPSIAGVPIVTKLTDLPNFDVVIITDMQTPQATFEKLLLVLPSDRILAPDLLRINRERPNMGQGKAYG